MRSDSHHQPPLIKGAFIRGFLCQGQRERWPALEAERWSNQVNDDLCIIQEGLEP